MQRVQAVLDVVGFPDAVECVNGHMVVAYGELKIHLPSAERFELGSMRLKAVFESGRWFAIEDAFTFQQVPSAQPSVVPPASAPSPARAPAPSPTGATPAVSVEHAPMGGFGRAGKPRPEVVEELARAGEPVAMTSAPTPIPTATPAPAAVTAPSAGPPPQAPARSPVAAATPAPARAAGGGGFGDLVQKSSPRVTPTMSGGGTVVAMKPAASISTRPKFDPKDPLDDDVPF